MLFQALKLILLALGFWDHTKSKNLSHSLQIFFVRGLIFIFLSQISFTARFPKYDLEKSVFR